MVDNLDGKKPSTHVLATMTVVERRLGEAMAKRMAPHGVVLRGSHARLLHLVPPDGVRPSELAQGWISRQAVGQRIQEMLEAGLVSVERDPQDGRASIVRRTPEGEGAMALVLRELAALEAELAAEVGQRRYRTFRAVLDELATG